MPSFPPSWPALSRLGRKTWSAEVDIPFSKIMAMSQETHHSMVRYVVRFPRKKDLYKKGR